MRNIITFFIIVSLLQVSDCFAVYYKLGDYYSGGRTVALDIQGDYVYTARYDGLFEIINISNPEEPQFVASIHFADIVPGVLGKVVVSDTLAFVLGRDAIHIINISAPSSPEYIGSWDYSWTSDIIISDNIAYIAGLSYLKILDISDIHSPYELSSLSGGLDGICLMDSLIYGVHSSSANNLRIVNISNSLNPVLISNNFDLPIYSDADIGYSDFHVFIVNGTNVWSINVADPVNPVASDTLFTENHTNGIFIHGDKAIIKHAGSGIKVLDITEPAKMEVMGFYDTPGYCEQVVAVNNIAFVADYSGIQIIDITESNIPYLVSSFQTNGIARGMSTQSDFLYIADGNTGMDVVDISDNYNPVLIGAYFDGIGSPDNVSTLNDKLCFSRNYPMSELLFADISEPDNPILQSQVELYTILPPSPTCSFQTDLHVFVGNGSFLRVYDITDLSNPIQVADYETHANITDVIVVDNIAYISVREQGVEILDFNEISSPQLIGFYDTPGSAEKIAIESNILVVADGKSGFHLLDVSDPVLPLLMESIMPNHNSNIIVAPLILENKMVIVDKEWNEIFTYNVHDLSNIQLLSSLKLNYEIYQIQHHSDLFLCSVYYYGVIMLDNSAILSIEENGEMNAELNNFKIYPNPTSDNTTISYCLNEKSFISIDITSSSGVKIKSLVNEVKGVGFHSIIWNGTNTNNNEVASGIYLVNIRYQNKNEIRKVLLMR